MPFGGQPRLLLRVEPYPALPACHAAALPRTRAHA
jgi:hypothetical protein